MKYLCNVGFIMLLGFSAQGQIDTLRSGFGGVVTISGLTQLDSLTWDVTITSSNWKGAWNPVANSEFAFTEVSVGDNFFVNCTVFRVNAIADPVPGTVKTLTVSRPSGIGNDPLLALNAAIFDRTSLQKLPRINRAVTEPGEIGLSREDYECLMNDFIARVEQNSVDAVRRDSTYQIAAIEDTLALSPIQGDRFVLLGQNLMGMYDSGAWVLIPIGGDGVFYYWTGYNAEYELPLDTLAKYDRVLIFTGTLPSDTTIITLPDINSDTQYDGKIIEVRYASGPGSVTIVESDDGIYRYNCIGYGSVEPNLAQDILTAGLYDLVRYTVAGSANYLRHCPIQDGSTGGISDSTSFVVYAPAHGLSDSITAYGYVPVMPGYFKANSSSLDSIHFAYAVGAPHVDSLILKLSGAITVTGHGLTINKLYYLNDDGTESQVQGTFRVPTVYVIDANTLLLTEVGSNESYLLEAKAYADSLFAVADSLREAGDRSTPVLIQAFDRIIQLDGCSTSETVITGFYLIDDTAIDEGEVTFEINASPASITYDVYNADSTSYYFETSVSRAAGIYTWEVGYTDPDGNFVGDMNSFEVVAGTPDTVTVPLNDSVFVTRRCGVEISRDTLHSKIIRNISDSTFLSSTPSREEILEMFPNDDNGTYIYKQDVELNDRKSSIREDHRYNSAPSLFKTNKGTLLVSYRRCKGHAGDGDVIVSRSENGIEWDHITVLENPDPISLGYYESILADFNADTIHLYTRYTNDTTVNTIDTAIIVHSISIDDGESWSLIDTLPSFYDVQIVGPAKGVEYEGRRMIPFYAVAGTEATSYVAGIMYTNDYGVTWDTSLYSQDTLLKLDESEIVLVGDTIVALIRSEEAGIQEQLFRTYSTDAGDTWATPELATISDWRRCHPGIIMLPNSNMLLNGRRLSSPTRRPTLWQSPDNGRTWETIGEIDSIGYSNYGSFELLNNNKVGLAYSVDNRHDGTYDDRSALKLAVFDVPGTIVFERSGGAIEKTSEEDFSYDDPVRNEELWTSTRHFFDENITITVCKDSCDYPTINQAFAWVVTQVAAFDSTIASPTITIHISRNEDGTAYEFSEGLFIPAGDWYPIIITSNGDSVLYTGSSFAFRQSSRGMSPRFTNFHLYDAGTGTHGIQLIGANSSLDQLIVDGFDTGINISEGNHFLYRSTIRNCEIGVFATRGYAYVRQDSIYDCTTGFSGQGGFVEFRDMRILNNTISVSAQLGAIFSYNNGTQQFWANGTSPTDNDLVFNANGGGIFRNFPESVAGCVLDCNTWSSGNYRGCEGLSAVNIDSTRLTQDSILVYYQDGSEVGRDTIPVSLGGGGSGLSGSGSSGQVALWDAGNTLTGSSNMTYSSPILTLAGTGNSLLLTPTSAPVNTAGKWYTSSGNYPHFMNGTTDWPLVRGSTESFTPGSLLFAGTSGQAQQDNANLFWDDTNNRLGIGTATPGSFISNNAALNVVDVVGANEVGVMIETTLPSSGSYSYGTWFRGGSGATSSTYPTLVRADFTAGYTGSSGTAALIFANSAASTGTNLYQATPGSFPTGNVGFAGAASGTTTGNNYGGATIAYGGNQNFGMYCRAIGNKDNANNIGVFGLAGNTGASSSQIGGLFSLGNITFTSSAALIADNGTTTSPIFRARDNGTDVLTVEDGGNVVITSTLYLNATKTVGIFTGTGSPESAVTASVGSTYHRTDGGAGTSFYVKESGTGNTGWVAK